MRVDRYDAISAARRDRRQSALILVVAAALASGVFLLRLVVSDPSASILVLVAVPVALVAVVFGRWVGLAAAAVGLALVAIYAATGGHVSALGFVARAVTFVMLGFGLGSFSDYVVESHRRMGELLDGTLDAVTVGLPVCDASGAIVDGRVAFINSPALQFMERSRDEILGHLWSELWPTSFTPELFGALVEVAQTGRTFEVTEFETSIDRPSGTLPVLLDLRASSYGDGVVIAWREVSGRVRDAHALATANARFAAAFEGAPVGMVLLDCSRVVRQANAALSEITGRPVEDLVGTSLDDLLDPRDLAQSHDDFRRLLSDELPAYYGERRIRHVDGSFRWVAVSVSKVSGEGATYVVEHIEDITERKSLEARLQHLADHDMLTGLFNRRRFNEELSHQAALDRRYARSSYVAVIDLDNFKYVNDTLGHAAGDQLIQDIAGALRSRLRSSDVLGRLGGDEFGVLLPFGEEIDPVTVVESLLSAVAAIELKVNGQVVRSTASIGVAAVGGDTDADPEAALANADLAMYAAKEAGRNTFVVYDPRGRHAQRSRARFQWLDRIRRALDEDSFVLHAQPLLDLTTNQVTGAELLLRLCVDDQVVPPERWLYVADKHGLATAIDRYVITHGIALAAEQDRPPGFRWEINLSAESLGDPDIPQLIDTELIRAGLPAATLVFEITETAVIANMTQALEFATRVNDIGCRFALDDFGAGYGSFYYLKHLPFDYLKIDGEFIRHLTVSSTDLVIVQAIVTAARRLGIETVAEYVGDQPTLDLLRSLHVDHAQGYFIGEPASV